MTRQHVTPDMVRDARHTVRAFTDAQQHDADLAFHLSHAVERKAQARRRAIRANVLLYGGGIVTIIGLAAMSIDLGAGIVIAVLAFGVAVIGQEMGQ